MKDPYFSPKPITNYVIGFFIAIGATLIPILCVLIL